MILSYEDGNTSYVKPNIHKPTIWTRCTYTQCVILVTTVMVFTKACLGSGFPELSVCGPVYHSNVPSKIKNQCLFLDKQLIQDICVDKRTLRPPEIHLKFCNMYTLNHIIPQNESERWMGKIECNQTLVDLMRSDNSAFEEFQLFASLLERVDCDTAYSVRWSCSVCREAYKFWLCSQNIPVYNRLSPSSLPPCDDFCSGVEKQCPFLKPLTESTYAGEPSFICKDPSSDMVPSLSEQCYKQCYLTDENNAKCLRHFPSRHNFSAALYSNTTESNSCCSICTNSFTRICVHLIGLYLVRTLLLFISIGLT
ncbi:NALCN channel auxiliary factor 2-like [Saccostrea echinata]|uniref:NALCN channel auxiliary factor 2-like n=1 Tax=Saccostrea echinata TaxID=191078 RepID=UPI002A836644|nr:NALCN channel auxiliary factor 2-like [Saccostrea echinata]XP_061180101.1 NALCN channel auxiliary factor 2-like [Saccostrea echinata]